MKPNGSESEGSGGAQCGQPGGASGACAFKLMVVKFTVGLEAKKNAASWHMGNLAANCVFDCHRRWALETSRMRDGPATSSWQRASFGSGG